MENRFSKLPAYGSITQLETIGQQSYTTITRRADLSFWYNNLVVTTDTKLKPVDRFNPHPQEYSKSVGQARYSGWSKSGTLDGRNSTVVAGPQTYVFSRTYGVPVGISSEAYNRCLSKVYDSVRSSVDLSIDLLQARQTIDMRRTFIRAVTAVRNFRRTFGRATFHSLANTSSEAWLTWQYGVRPLLGTLYESLDNMKRGYARCFVVKERVTLRQNKQAKENPTSIDGDPRLAGKLIVSEWTSQRCEIRCEFSLDNSILQKLGDWTSLNPVSIGWELLPYSFVIDWFVDVGGYLRNLESAFLYRTSFTRGYVTYTTKAGQNAVIQSGYSDVSTQTYRYYNLSASRMDSWKKRTVIFTIPLPFTPRFSVNLGWQRFLSAASLITAASSRGGVWEDVRQEDAAWRRKMDIQNRTRSLRR